MRAAVLLAPVPAVALGMWVATASGVPYAAFLPNLAALVIGSLAALVVGRRPAGAERRATGLPIGAVVAVGATLLATGIDGVHRWLPLGPLRLHASAAFAPWVFAGLLSQHPRARTTATIAAIALQIVHVAQPDAAQATAFAAGAFALFADRLAWPPSRGLPIAALLGGLAVATWFRADPLPAVAHVERIVSMTFQRGPVPQLAFAIAFSLLFAPFLWKARRQRAYSLGASAVLYFGGAAAATWFGNFPFPVLGAGAGPVLGWYAMWSVVLLREGTPPEGPEGPPDATKEQAISGAAETR